MIDSSSLAKTPTTTMMTEAWLEMVLLGDCIGSSRVETQFGETISSPLCHDHLESGPLRFLGRVGRLSENQTFSREQQLVEVGQNKAGEGERNRESYKFGCNWVQ